MKLAKAVVAIGFASSMVLSGGPASANGELSVCAETSPTCTDISYTSGVVAGFPNLSSGLLGGGVWSVVVATGINTLPGVLNLDLDLSANATGAGTLEAVYSLTGLSFGAGTHSFLLNGAITNNAGPNVSWTVCVDDANAISTAQTSLAGTCITQAVPGSGASLSGVFTVTDTFSVTIAEFLSPRSAFSGYSIDGNVHLAEPSALLLLGVGLLGVAIIRRRKTS